MTASDGGADGPEGLDGFAGVAGALGVDGGGPGLLDRVGGRPGGRCGGGSRWCRQPKFPFGGPVVAIPGWRSLAAVSIVLAVLAFGLLLIDGSGLKQRGRAFLALIAFGVQPLYA